MKGKRAGDRGRWLVPVGFSFPLKIKWIFIMLFSKGRNQEKPTSHRRDPEDVIVFASFRSFVSFAVPSFSLGLNEKEEQRTKDQRRQMTSKIQVTSLWFHFLFIPLSFPIII